jgi:hypothetical protein
VRGAPREGELLVPEATDAASVGDDPPGETSAGEGGMRPGGRARRTARVSRIMRDQIMVRILDSSGTNGAGAQAQTKTAFIAR